MIRRASSSFRLVAGVALAAGVLGVAEVSGAQGEGPTAATSTVSREGIAEAKKDFETIKSVRDAALEPSGRMPKVSVPELSLPAAPSTTGATKAKSRPRESKSANWLVDAMEKGSSGNQLQDIRARDKTGRIGGRDRDSADDSDGLGLSKSDKEPSRIEQERRESRREEDVTSAVGTNPFNDFLGTWMTPQDYALLKPGLMPANNSAPGVAVSPPPASAGGTISSGGLSELTRPGSASPATSFQTVRENPYLQSLKPELPSTVSTTRRQIDPTISAPAPTRSAPVITPSPVTPPPAKVPEFGKPSTDDRYFKQLKRF